jgi:hypothetical protein
MILAFLLSSPAQAEGSLVLVDLDPSVLSPFPESTCPVDDGGPGGGFEEFKRVVRRKILPGFAMRFTAGVPVGAGAGLSYQTGSGYPASASLDYGVLPPFTSISGKVALPLPKLTMFRLKFGFTRIGIGPVWRRVAAYEANQIISDWYGKYGVYDVNYAIPENVFRFAVSGPTLGIEWKYKKLCVEAGIHYADWQAAIAQLYDQAGNHVMERTLRLRDAGILNAEDVEATEIFLKERRQQLLGEELPKAFSRLPIGSRFVPYAELRLELPFALR